MSLPAKILPRLGQLIRLLDSDQDGEALAAARAIGRALKADGATFHDLAEAVEAGQSPAPSKSYYHSDWQPPEPTHKAPPTWNELRGFERRNWLTAFVRKLDVPDETEMAELVQFRSQCVVDLMTCPTIRQLELFTRLMEQAWNVGVRP
ncbi:MAG: hypothetical protein ACRYGP_16785 [Janthinobacterium lividum]